MYFYVLTCRESRKRPVTSRTYIVVYRGELTNVRAPMHNYLFAHGFFHPASRSFLWTSLKVYSSLAEYT